MFPAAHVPFVQATGNKYLAAPKTKPSVCSPALLTKTPSAGKLDLQCNDPDDLPRQLPDDWSGQCSLGSFIFAELIALPKSKAAQWCNGRSNQVPNNSANWKFIKVA